MKILIFFSLIFFIIAIGSIIAKYSRRKSKAINKVPHDVGGQVLDECYADNVKRSIGQVVDAYFESNGSRNLSINIDTGYLPEDIKNFEFVSLDFETANQNRESAISLGLAFFTGNRLTGLKKYTFKNADKGKIIFSHIHGLTAEDIGSSPYFDSYWPEIKDLIRGKTIVGHNVIFDLQVLTSLIRHFNMDCFQPNYICTLEFYKQTMTTYMGKRTLEVLCAEHQIPYWNHNALYDAISAGILFLVVAEKSFSRGELGNRLLGKEYVEENKEFSGKKFRVSQKNNKEVVLTSSSIMDLSEEDLVNKHIVVTGQFHNFDRDLAEDHVREIGAVLRTSVTGKTFMVITGLDPGPAKIEKIELVNEKRLEKGDPKILVLNEIGFIELLKKYNKF